MLRSFLLLFPLFWTISACVEEKGLPPGHGGGGNPPVGNLPEDTEDGSDETGGSEGSDTGECDPYEQPSSCLAGEKCSYYNTSCLEEIGEKAIDEPCTLFAKESPINDDCASSLLCAFDQGIGNFSRCLQGCRVEDSTICAQERVCADWSATDFGIGAEGVCFEQCQLQAPACTLAKDNCYPVNAGDSRVAACLPTLVFGNDGDTCRTVRDCSSGLHCVDTMLLTECPGERCCSPLCDVLNSPCQGANPQCQSLQIEGQLNVGVCIQG